jgi:hypothetical protein
VFLLRVITHDWPDADVRRILARLREAATARTQLVIGEHILGEAIAGGQRYGMEEDDGAGLCWPLLANGGAASTCGHYMDMTVRFVALCHAI